jgi:hypothetical protein
MVSDLLSADQFQHNHYQFKNEKFVSLNQDNDAHVCIFSKDLCALLIASLQFISLFEAKHYGPPLGFLTKFRFAKISRNWLRNDFRVSRK